MTSRYDHYATHHTSRRTDDWDYTQPAAYFVTICTADRMHLFGTVEEGRMSLNVPGRIAAEEWQRSETIRDRVHLDAFVVMPNHLHGIVVFADPAVEAPTCPRGYRLLGGGESEDRLQESRSEKASTGGSGDSTDESHSMKASTGGSTLSGEKSDAPDEPDPDGKSADDRPTGPAPRSLGLFVVPGSNPPSPGASTIIETYLGPRCGNAIITIASSKTNASGEMHEHASNVPWIETRAQR